MLSNWMKGAVGGGKCGELKWELNPKEHPTGIAVKQHCQTGRRTCFPSQFYCEHHQLLINLLLFSFYVTLWFLSEICKNTPLSIDEFHLKASLHLELVSNPIHSGTPPIFCHWNSHFLSIKPQFLFVLASWLNPVLADDVPCFERRNPNDFLEKSGDAESRTTPSSSRSAVPVRMCHGAWLEGKAW